MEFLNKIFAGSDTQKISELSISLAQQLQDSLKNFLFSESFKQIALLLVLAVVLISVIGKIIQIFVKPKPKPPYWDKKTGLFPIFIKKFKFNLSRKYELTDSDGKIYYAVKYNYPFTFLLTSFLLVFVIYPLFSYVYVSRMQGNADFYLTVVLLLFAAAVIFLVLALINILFYSSKIMLYDKAGRFLGKAAKRFFMFNLFSTKITVTNKKDKLLAQLMRPKFKMLKKWRLLLVKKNVVLEFNEISKPKSVLRRIFGHSWGALKSEYNILAGGKAAGKILREKNPSHNFAVNIAEFTDIDPLLTAFTAVCTDTYSPDKFHPWFH
jgi:hypothetical protein